jgi:hypothetical protein
VNKLDTPVKAVTLVEPAGQIHQGANLESEEYRLGTDSCKTTAAYPFSSVFHQKELQLYLFKGSSFRR